MSAVTKKSASKKSAAKGSAATTAKGSTPKNTGRFRRHIGAIVGGLLLFTAFPEASIWPLAFIALAILISILEAVRPWTAAWYSLLFGLSFFIPHIYWVLTATDMVLAWLALAVVESLFIACFGLVFTTVFRTWNWAKTIPGLAVSAAVFWVAFEELRSRIPYGGFAWAKLAYIQVDSPLIVLAPVGGEVLVSLVTVILSVLLLKTFQWGRRAPQLVRVRFATGFVFVSTTICGLLINLPNSQEAGSVTVGVVQGNVEIPMEETYSTAHQVTENHASESLELAAANKQLDFVVWGENSLDLDPREDQETAEIVQDAVDSLGVPTLVGFVEETQTQTFNWIGFWYPQIDETDENSDSSESHDSGLDETLYGKQHPVPWGEWVPLREWTEKLAPSIEELIPKDMASVDNQAYLEVSLLDGRTVPLAVGICFEVAYESIINQGVLAGGQLIVVPTNNSHFEYSSESTQQLQILRFRAAEYSRAAIQVSTNGVSGVIRPDGMIMSSTEKQVADFLVWQLPLRTTVTLAAKLGQFPAYLVLSGAACVFIGALFQNARSSIAPSGGRRS